MTNVYITKKFLTNTRYLPILFPHLGELKNEKQLFADRGKRAFREPAFNLVEKIEFADFVLLPHEYFDVIKKDASYLSWHRELAKKHGKKLLIFDFSDYTDTEIDVPEAIVFRVAVYRSRKKNNEIIVPTFVEDLSSFADLRHRTKNACPTVGFCGWGSLPDFKSRVNLLIKNFVISIKKTVRRDENLEATRRGIYFRIKAIKEIKKCNNIITKFILRKKYSSHVNTIELGYAQARSEYVQNILDSDLALAIRGDANTSCRFYEILSLGRIPLFVDTDCILPLEDVIDYKKFVVFVDYGDMDNICETALNFYKNTNEDDFIAMQKTAREMFEKYLNTTSFFKYILPKLAEYKN